MHKIFWPHRVNGYAKAEMSDIHVDSNLLLKQSNFKSDVISENKIRALLANYTKLEPSVGIFGEHPQGYVKT